MSDRVKKADKELNAPDPEIPQTVDQVNFTKGSVDQYKFYPDNPTSEENKRKFASKEPSKYFDPCNQSAQMSIRCLENNDYNKDMCHEYFKAYRECKKEWLQKRREDRYKGNGW